MIHIPRDADGMTYAQPQIPSQRPLVPEDRSRPALSLLRAAYCHARAVAKGHTSAEQVAQDRYHDEVASILTRGASSAATTTNSAWAAVLARQATGDFLLSLEPLSAASKILNLAPRVSLAGVASIQFPTRTGPTTAAKWVAEIAPIPAIQFSLSSATVGPTHKLAAVACATREVIESGAGETVVSTLLRESAALGLDTKMFSADAADSSAPAGLLNGIAALTATTGGGLSAALSDLGKIAAAIAANTSGPIVFVTNPAQAGYLALQGGGSISPNIQVFPTLGVAAGTIIGLDPACLVSAYGGEPELSATPEPLLHMEDTTPLNIGTAGSPATVAAPSRSMFQTDCIATRMILRASWAVRAAGCAAWISGATW